MSDWQCRTGRLEGIRIIERPVFADARGCFSELWHADRYAAAGITESFVQDNYSRSVQHTLRGLHYQIHNPQTKLVTCVEGTIWDVAVDLRPSSPTFLQWEGEELSGENGLQLFIPQGFAHGFLVLSEWAHVMYKCDSHYDPANEAGVRWDDPEIGINWPLSGSPILSPKDTALCHWKDLPVDQRPR